jgi:hypothetical protein
VSELKFTRKPTEKTLDGSKPGETPGERKKEEGRNVEETYGEDAE